MMSRAISFADPVFWLRAALVAVLLLVAWPVLADDETVVESFTVVQPRAAGYQLGDVLERTVRMRIRQPYALVESELPEAGRVNHWLWLDPPQVDRATRGRSTEYEIRLNYRVLNYKPEITDVPIPSHELRFSDGDDEVTLLIRPARTRLSPISLNGDFDVRPDTAPAPVQRPLTTLLLAGAVLLSALLLLAAHYWRFALPVRGKPFTAACRELRRAAKGRGELNPGLAFERIHRAFDETDGRTVFEHELAAFIERHPNFASLESRMVSFFESSRRHFYTDADAGASSESLLDFARACSDAELGAQS